MLARQGLAALVARLVLLGAAAWMPWSLAAQSPHTVSPAPRLAAAQRPADRVLEGRVKRPGTSADQPVGDAWVVLHRVGPDTAGPVDSTRTRADGSYRFRYRATGDTQAVYFAATHYGGIAYFTPPGNAPRVRGVGGDILVYDTTSAPVPIAIRGRHVIVTAVQATARRRIVYEAYEISNDTVVTRIARGGDGLTFDAPLPKGVQRITAGQGDISDDAIRAVDGRVRVTAPLAPGIKQVSFSYEVEASPRPIEVLVESPITVLEVLVEDPAGVADGAGLVAADPVEIEGRSFRRFLARDVAGAQTFRVTVPMVASARGLRLMLIVTAVGAAMLLGLGMVFLRKGPAGFARRREEDPEALALAIAALDAAFERVSAPSESQRAEHYVARARLKGRLSEVLAKRDGLR